MRWPLMIGILATLSVSGAFAQPVIPSVPGPPPHAPYILNSAGSAYVPWQQGSAVAPPVAVTSLPALPAGTNTIGSVTAVPSPVAPVSSTAVEGTHVLKSSAGNLYSLSVTTTTTSGYLMLFNATAAPADGAVTPAYCLAVPSATSMGVSWTTPLTLSTGISVAFSSTGCFTKTSSATAVFSAQVQ